MTGKGIIGSERTEALKGIIRDLHAGVDLAILKRRFADLVQEVGAEEIPKLEQELVAEGLPAEEITRLCDVHVQLFKESLDRQGKPESEAGHPVHTFMAENQALGEAAKNFQELLQRLGSPPDREVFVYLAPRISETLDRLAQVEVHYQRKEHQLFPYLEKHGLSAPPQVMWTIHDQVRALVKKVRTALQESDLSALSGHGAELTRIMLDMVYKEEHILFPMALKTLSEDEWAEIRRGESEVGYALVRPGEKWRPAAQPAEKPAELEPDLLDWDTGRMSREQVNLILKHLPVEITFVDENDAVRYFSAHAHRIFVRSPGIIGRKVQNCHPPKSLHVVNRILREFRAGTRDEAVFWIQHRGRTVHISYRAVRDAAGAYRGTIEVIQDITDLRKVEGERRLLDWEGANP